MKNRIFLILIFSAIRVSYSFGQNHSQEQIRQDSLRAIERKEERRSHLQNYFQGIKRGLNDTFSFEKNKRNTAKARSEKEDRTYRQELPANASVVTFNSLGIRGKMDEVNNRGVFRVVGVQERSPAYFANIQPDDFIIELGGFRNFRNVGVIENYLNTIQYGEMAVLSMSSGTKFLRASKDERGKWLSSVIPPDHVDQAREEIKKEIDLKFNQALDFLLQEPCNRNWTYVKSVDKDLSVLATKAGIYDVGFDTDLDRKRQTVCENATLGFLAEKPTILWAITGDVIDPCAHSLQIDYSKEIQEQRRTLSKKMYDDHSFIRLRNFVRRNENGKCLIGVIESILTSPVKPD